MPRERIVSENSGLDVEVSWGREGGYVQVATTCPDLDRAVTVAKEIVEFKAAHPDETLLTTGYHADLDRARINELIRTLRKARDQAFGRDE
jgi:hypothetical protein